jgi:Mg2+ and Co2+ transporter CorA
MSKPDPAPLSAADNCVATAKAARLHNEKISVHFAGMKKSVAPLLAFPADMLAEALCQMHERPKILQLRKAIGSLMELVESKQESIDMLLESVESAAETMRTMQRTIDSQAQSLEEYRNV